ncbi:MAG TPA: peptidoglycan-associated lipoprotein Pal [Burkholderiaceae bacterium]|jgi:peptidoglycan-associated lipoprotein|nr:peptidoglycan-associated lipoprotein Pal [Burkholderiaceae bacterium]
MNQKYRLAFVFAGLVGLAACSSVKLDDKAAGAPIDNRGGAAGSGSAAGSAGSAGATAGGSGARQVTPVEVSQKDPLSDPGGVLSKRSIYFDFDQYTIRDEFKSVLEAHAKYLMANKERKVILQGNADERGSREYNLALGQKRSEAVSRALQALGVSASQLEAVSLGEEKPKATGVDEASFAENRRADLVYQ